MTTSRRTLLTGLTGTSAALALSACGNNDTTPAPRRTATPLSPATSDYTTTGTTRPGTTLWLERALPTGTELYRLDPTHPGEPISRVVTTSLSATHQPHGTGSLVSHRDDLAGVANPPGMLHGIWQTSPDPLGAHPASLQMMATKATGPNPMAGIDDITLTGDTATMVTHVLRTGGATGHRWVPVLQRVQSGKVLTELVLDHLPQATSPRLIIGAANPWQVSSLHDTGKVIVLALQAADTVMAIEPKTGKPLWSLGRGQGVASPRHVRLHGTTLTLLHAPGGRPCASVLTVDAHGHVTNRTDHHAPENLASQHGGSAQLLPDGSLLAGWGAQLTGGDTVASLYAPHAGTGASPVWNLHDTRAKGTGTAHGSLRVYA